MKDIYYKLISIFLLCLITNVRVFAGENKVQIEDELLQDDSFKYHAQTSTKKDNAPITDELLNSTLYKKIPFGLSAYVNKYANEPIEDELIEDREQQKKLVHPYRKYQL